MCAQHIEQYVGVRVLDKYGHKRMVTIPQCWYYAPSGRAKILSTSQGSSKPTLGWMS